MVTTEWEYCTMPGGYSPFDTRQDCWFDPERAAKAVRFFPKYVKHTKGRSGPLELERWQQNIVATIFGWRRPDGTRRYRMAYVEIPRKAGKSTLASGIALLLLYMDGEKGAEVYSCAAERDQAALVFEMAKGSVLLSPALNNRSKIFQRAIVVHDPGTGLPTGSYKVLSADAKTKHGYGPSGIIFDELHAQPSPELWETMTTGVGARSQPLTFAITTAGYDRLSICYRMHTLAASVRDGTNKNVGVLPVIYAADEKDDWQSPAVWAKAQPNLGISVPTSFYEEECLKAKQDPAYENTFRRLYLNQWTEQDERWLSMDAWREGGKREIPDLTGMPCWLGLDLSTTEDFTALVQVFDAGDGGVYVIPHFWIPEERARKKERVDRIPCLKWIRQGLVNAVPGDQIEYGPIAEKISELSEQYDVRMIAFDRWNATALTQRLGLDGFGERLKPFGQGVVSMSAPSKELSRLLSSRKLYHGGNEVLEWMAGNVAKETDSADNWKPCKKKSRDRIDGIVATVMGVAMWMEFGKEEMSAWSREDGLCL